MLLVTFPTNLNFKRNFVDILDGNEKISAGFQNTKQFRCLFDEQWQLDVIVFWIIAHFCYRMQN